MADTPTANGAQPREALPVQNVLNFVDIHGVPFHDLKVVTENFTSIGLTGHGETVFGSDGKVGGVFGCERTLSRSLISVPVEFASTEPIQFEFSLLDVKRSPETFIVDVQFVDEARRVFEAHPGKHAKRHEDVFERVMYVSISDPSERTNSNYVPVILAALAGEPGKRRGNRLLENGIDQICVLDPKRFDTGVPGRPLSEAQKEARGNMKIVLVEGFHEVTSVSPKVSKPSDRNAKVVEAEFMGLSFSRFSLDAAAQEKFVQDMFAPTSSIGKAAFDEIRAKHPDLSVDVATKMAFKAGRRVTAQLNRFLVSDNIPAFDRRSFEREGNQVLLYEKTKDGLGCLTTVSTAPTDAGRKQTKEIVHNVLISQPSSFYVKLKSAPMGPQERFGYTPKPITETAILGALAGQKSEPIAVGRRMLQNADGDLVAQALPYHGDKRTAHKLDGTLHLLDSRARSGKFLVLTGALATWLTHGDTPTVVTALETVAVATGVIPLIRFGKLRAESHTRHKDFDRRVAINNGSTLVGGGYHSHTADDANSTDGQPGDSWWESTDSYNYGADPSINVTPNDGNDSA